MERQVHCEGVNRPNSGGAFNFTYDPQKRRKLVWPFILKTCYPWFYMPRFHYG